MSLPTKSIVIWILEPNGRSGSRFPSNVLAKASQEHKLDASLHIQEVEHPAPEVDLTPASARTPSRFQTGQQNAAATYSTKLSQVVVAPTKPSMEEPQGLDLDQSDWDCSDDNFDPRFIGGHNP